MLKPPTLRWPYRNGWLSFEATATGPHPQPRIRHGHRKVRRFNMATPPLGRPQVDAIAEVFPHSISLFSAVKDSGKVSRLSGGNVLAAGTSGGARASGLRSIRAST